jgi:hypothetical protein
VSQSFGYIPKSGIAASNGRSMFSFLSSLQIFFQSGCTSLHSHQQCMRIPFSLHERMVLTSHRNRHIGSESKSRYDRLGW